MKRSATILFTILCASVFAVACEEDKWATTCPPERDDFSLAGSICFRAYHMQIEGSYDDAILMDFQPGTSFMSIEKVSDTEVELFCRSLWGKTKFEITIPQIPLSGMPHEASFDYTSADASASHGEVGNNPTSASIKGWIAEQGDRVSPYPSYLCDIDIACTVDGKLLTLKITALKP